MWHVGFFLPAPRIAEEAVEAVPEQTTPRDTVMRVMTLNTTNGNAAAVPACTITAGSHEVRLVSAHPTSPKTGTLGFWNESLTNLGTLRRYSDEYLIMGDFNSTWDHSRYRKMLGDTLVDASEQAGEGFHMTYPSEPHYAMVPVPPMIEIDHIVYSKNSGMSVGDLETVNVQGSDHFALLGTWVIE